MAQRGGLSHINYKETKGLKINAGELVKTGTILTRQGNKWKKGVNVEGRGTLYAKLEGRVYFTKKRGSYKKNKLYTFIHIKPQAILSKTSSKSKLRQTRQS